MNVHHEGHEGRKGVQELLPFQFLSFVVFVFSVVRCLYDFGCGSAALGLCSESEFGYLTAEAPRAQSKEFLIRNSPNSGTSVPQR